MNKICKWKLAGIRKRVFTPKVLCLLVMSLMAGDVWAGSLEFRRQSISVPTQMKAWASWQMTLFADIDDDGRDDLLAIGPVENKLWIYRQQSFGFSSNPDQTLQLPPNTAWVTLCDVDLHPGVELLISSATGLAFLVQQKGVFTEQARILAVGNQVFANTTYPILIWPNQLKSGTNDIIPAIFLKDAALYQRDGVSRWYPTERLPLRSRDASLTLEEGDWATGLHPSYSMRIRQSFLANPIESAENPEGRAEKDAIKKILQEIAQDDDEHPQFTRLDIDVDSQPDLAFWKIAGNLDPKTDLFFFLRGADRQLPKKPTQVLHCRGFPIPVGPLQQISPLCDLNGDGIHELMLMTLKKTVASSSTIVEMVLSRGVDWRMTINTWKRGAFSRDQKGILNLTTMLPGEKGAQPLFLVDGDFNKDGRRDVLARRSANQWDIFISTTKEGWFEQEPAATLDLPEEGFFEIRDLNRDGMSDLIVRIAQEARLSIVLSRSAAGKVRTR